MNSKTKLILIPKYEKHIEYMLDVILKLPRTEKFSIGTEYKSILYENMRYIIYINGLRDGKRLVYLNLLDANLNIERVLLRIMYKYRWIDKKKFEVSIFQIADIGRIIGGLQNKSKKV